METERLLDAPTIPAAILTAVWGCSQLGGFTQAEAKVIAQWAAPPTLHLFCGLSSIGEVRVDLDPTSVATVHEDVLDFIVQEADGSYQTVLADPPYNGKYQQEYGVPGRDFGGNESNLGLLLRQMYRLCRPGGLLIFKHWFDPAWAGSKLVEQVVTKYGGHRRITLLTVYRKSSWASSSG